MEQVNAFKAIDGTLFSTSVGCKEYEVSLVFQEEIAEFIESEKNPYSKAPQKGMCKSIIVAWEIFKSGVSSNE